MSDTIVVLALALTIFVYIGMRRFHALTRQRDALLQLRRDLARLSKIFDRPKLNPKPN